MKKITLTFITVVILLTLTVSCQKEIVMADEKNNIQFEENGFLWQGWRVANPPSKFDPAADRIVFEDSVNNDAPAKLAGKTLLHTGPRVIYAVQPFILGNFNVMKSDLERRGWKIAPLAYLIALGKEYGFWNNFYYWNLYCLDIPAKINFGTGDELAAISLSGNTYNPTTNTQYNIALRLTPFAQNYSGVTVLAYR